LITVIATKIANISYRERYT